MSPSFFDEKTYWQEEYGRYFISLHSYKIFILYNLAFKLKDMCPCNMSLLVLENSIFNHQLKRKKGKGLSSILLFIQQV